MSKRSYPLADEDRPPKRPRPEKQAPEVEQIYFARQLQERLTFNQDGVNELRHGVACFKAFLETILYHKEEDERARQVSILREYLESQKPLDPANFERPILSQLWQGWSFANLNNVDFLASSISAVLALLLKTISEILDLREYGLLICRTVLQHQNLRLVKRCLDAPKEKDFLISPCLRLLTEVAAFDGGVLAREVYKRREQTFEISTLRRNLYLIKSDVSDEEARRRPAVRSHALRYVLSLLKYLHEGGKIDILKNRAVCSALFQHLRDDPAELVIELLSTVEQSVLKPDDMPRSSKAALLTPQNLEKVRDIASRNITESATSQKAFRWLKDVCTTPSYGILRRSGWYPAGTTTLEHAPQDKSITLGLDSLDFYDVDTRSHVRNPVLLSWIQTLRPQTNYQDRELLITCLASAPELVAAYFTEKELQLEPKLTNTWIGYASLLFEIIQLPVPDHLGNELEWAQLPPQTSVMMANILPRPLSTAVLCRCLKQSSELVTFFAIRILVLAFQKLRQVLRLLHTHQEDAKNGLWKEAETRLLQRFIAQCPPMKDLTLCFRQMSDDADHLMQREAISRLLRLCYEITPLQALAENFDISAALTSALLRSEARVEEPPDEGGQLHNLELEHLLAIAQSSPGMRWFSSQGGLVFSPVVTLLRIHRNQTANNKIRSLLNHVLVEHNVLQSSSSAESSELGPLDALVASVLNLPHDRNIWLFIDDCIARATRKPVKYVDDLDLLATPTQSVSLDASRPSILAAVLLEQAGFVASKQEQESVEKTKWIVHFLQCLRHTSDECEILKSLVARLNDIPGFSSEARTTDTSGLLEKVRQQAVFPRRDPTAALITTPASGETPSTLNFSKPPAEADNHPELVRINHKDADLAIQDGDLDQVMLCLCSQHGDIRIQAKMQLNKLKTHLQANPGHESNEQICLLLGELLETFGQKYEPENRPLPYVAGTFAVRALHVLMQPAHSAYPKLNKFLIRGPEWRVSRLPAYWLSNTSLNLPDEDDAYWNEVQWVLDWLVDGLRTAVDLHIFRRAGVFERVMALWSSPSAAVHKPIRESVIELIFRATCVEGGSDVLVTRTGVVSWLDVVAAHDRSVEAALRTRIKQTCDMDRIKAWAGGVGI